jgi:hypothetical protein
MIIGVGVGPSTRGGGGNSPTIKGSIPVLKLVTKFFEELRTNYQGVKIEKLCTLQEL